MKRELHNTTNKALDEVVKGLFWCLFLPKIHFYSNFFCTYHFLLTNILPVRNNRFVIIHFRRRLFMKKRTFYFIISLIGIVLPFVIIFVCRKLNYENDLVIPIISSVTTIFSMIATMLKDLFKKKEPTNITEKNSITTIGTRNEVSSENTVNIKENGGIE